MRSASKEKINIPDTQDLFKSKDRNYSCSFLVNMDPSLMALISPGTNLVDSAKNVHSLDVLNRVAFRLTFFCKKIPNHITFSTGRKIAQFCFGSTKIQLNPTYQKLDRMDPKTWKKEGLSNHWSGTRGFKKSCCKVCCRDKLCVGCTACRCRHGTVRG